MWQVVMCGIEARAGGGGGSTYTNGASWVWTGEFAWSLQLVLGGLLQWLFSLDARLFGGWRLLS
jgi:hypothetical protein